MEFKYEFFKEQYDKQQELKESLNNRFTIIMTIVPLLFTGIFFCFKNINDLEKYPFWFYSVSILGFISLILDVIIIALLMRHFLGKNMKFSNNLVNGNVCIKNMKHMRITS